MSWSKGILRFHKFSPVRPRNASVVAPLPRPRALSSQQGMNFHPCWWHGSQAQALKGALWASLPLWKACGTHCIFGASPTWGHSLSQWGGLTTHGRTSTGAETGYWAAALVSWGEWEAQPGCLSWVCSPCGERIPQAQLQTPLLGINPLWIAK